MAVFVNVKKIYLIVYNWNNNKLQKSWKTKLLILKKIKIQTVIVCFSKGKQIISCQEWK